MVISGHVITLGLRRQLASDGTLDLHRFYQRRAQRLLPALLAMLAVVIATGAFLTPVGALGQTLRTAVGSALLHANFVLANQPTDYFAPATELNPLLHTWSLSLEEQFYLVFPAVLLLTAAFLTRRGRRPTGPGLLLVVLAMGLWSFALAATSQDASYAFYSPFTRSWQFLLGAGTALVPNLVRSSRVRGALRLAGLAAILFAAVAFTDHDGLTTAIVASVGAALVMLAPAAQTDPTGRMLGAAPIVRLGDLSYSWYLWHWPCIVLLRAWWPTVTWMALAGGVLSLVPALLSWRLLENRIRHRPWRTSRGVWFTAATAAVVALALLGGAVLGSEPLDRGGYAQARSPHIDEATGCATPEALGARGSLDCTWHWPGSTEASGTAVLVGDSTAGMLSEAFIDAAHDLALDATIATYYGCPFTSARITRSGAAEPRCDRFVQDTLDALQQLRPEVVVLSVATDIYAKRADLQVVSSGGETATDPGDKERVLGEGLEATISALTASGIRVVLVHTIPKFEPWTLDACARGRLLTTPAACGTSMDLRTLDVQRKRAMAVELRAAEAGGATTLDLADTLCTTVCVTWNGDAWMWRDGGHLSIAAATLLRAPLAAALRASLAN